MHAEKMKNLMTDIERRSDKGPEYVSNSLHLRVTLIKDVNVGTSSCCSIVTRRTSTRDRS